MAEDPFPSEDLSDEPDELELSLLPAFVAELSLDFVEVLFALEDFRLSVT
ncbi:MAG TPA: hypothetical protein VMW87_16105 [Spirochaetia bacterium]|nr:hypothetical protein [Spirochaetia bacterium]